MDITAHSLRSIATLAFTIGMVAFLGWHPAGATTSVATDFEGFALGDVNGQVRAWYVSPTGSDVADCATAATPCLTIGAAVGKASAGDTINVAAGTFTQSSQLNLNKANLTLAGAGSGSTIVRVSGTGYRFYITAAGVTIQGFGIQKTDKAGLQNIIYIGASNVSITNNEISGQYVFGDSDVSRAIEVTGGLTGLNISGNTIHQLRQPAYINGVTTGMVSGNFVYLTRGWVAADGNMTFTSNTWGTGANANVFDIAILSGASPAYYTDVPAMAAANNGAFIEDQRTSPATLSLVSVDGSVIASGTGTASSPVKTIAEGVARVVTGGTVHVAAGTYTEQVTITKNLHLTGAGVGASIIQAPGTMPGYTDQNSNIVKISGSGTNVELDGFTITGPGPSGCGSISGGIFVRDGAYANIHDNRIQDVRDPLSCGSQNGSAIWVGRQAWSTSGTATINHNVIVGYQKTGIVVDNAGSNATITNNTVTGAGTSDVLARNGIQVSRHATATLSGNTVTGNSYNGAADPSSTWQSAGILLFQSGAVTMSGGNSVSGNDQNIDKTGSSGTLTLGAETLGASTAPAGIGFDIYNDDSDAIGATAVTFTGAADGFAIEDRVFHKMDDATRGLVTWTANNVYVTTGGSIQRGIDAVSSGGTTNVAPGTYRENVTITRPLTLRSSSGPGATFIDASITGNPYVVFISDKYVTLDGFDISSPGYTGTADASGVVVEPSPYGLNSQVRITNNTIHDIGSPGRTAVTYGTVGINIGMADGVEIDHNRIYNIIHSDPQAWANGISIWGGDPTTPSDHINIHDNSFRDISSPYPADAAISTQTDVGANVTVVHNSIVSTSGHPTEFGVQVLGSNIVDATANWWGNVSGPGNPTGVNATPWCTDSACSTLSNNAYLTSLSLSSGTLSPVFNPSTTAYSASVENGTASVIVTETTNPGANAVVTGGLSLSVGSNAVTIAVTAADGTMTNTYTVTVTRSAPLPPEPPAPTTGTESLPTGTTTVTSTLDTSDTVATVTSGGTITTGTGTQDIATFAWYSTDGTATPVDLTPPQEVGGGISVTVGMAVTLSSGTAGEPITLTTTAMPNVSVEIPDITNVLAPAGWDGKINPPTVGTSEGTPPSGFSVGGTVVEVGSTTAVLLFDRPVSVVLNGVTGVVGYRPSGSDTWVAISPCGAGGPVFPGACSQSDGVNTTILTYHFTEFAALVAITGALPTQQTTVATSTGLTCFAYSGPTTLAAAFAPYFSSGVTAINRFNLPAGNYSSWFRAAPSLATLTSLASGDIICVNGPAGTNVFVAGAAAGATTPVTAPTTPVTVTTATTATGVYCFAYSGPATAVANFTTRFNSAIVAINRLNLPDGKFSSWFAAAPSLSTIVSLSNGDLLCVASPSATSVFDTSHNVQPIPAPTPIPAPATTTYVVQSGDTLTDIAAQFHTTVAVLQQLNGITNPNLVRIGQQLIVPASQPPPPAQATTTYVIQPGDTLTDLAAQFHTTVAVLIQLNGITNPSLIWIGQTLIVPAL